ncbi:MAG: DeoR/GlpR transcriptional regulator [Clostridia bacterium]|jgi:DeoR family transcriptional regulator, fructose operon transcriptional repressor|nr:DeoR/GlpR transcriptional regulator [Clostridia bacterium]MBT7122430.1 DeoR/GlpR transcriptional regulator [Clostridia bacterium]
MNNNPEENIFAEERKQMIVELINRQIKTTVAALCEKFSVSPATIRNDLRELELAGLLKRTHGGAMSNKKASFELNSYQKEVENIEQKVAIGKAAMNYVQDGDIIAIDTGTTTLEFAKQLADKKNITVVTNDLKIALHLEENSQMDVVLTGGAVRRNFHSTIGLIALNSLKELSVDRSFIAANGVEVRRGITTPNIEQAQVKERLVEFADEVILLADSTKLGKASFAKFADLKEIDHIITDSDAPEEIVAEIESKGISVEIA